MTKKSRQVASRYARRRAQAKRKPPQKTDHPSAVKHTSDKPAQAGVQGLSPQQTKEVRSKQMTESIPKIISQPKAPIVASIYSYVASDLKRAGIIAGAIFILLIVLAIIFG